LVEWYKKDLKNKGLEVIFVSSDRDEAAFNDYFKDMPWLALDFSDRDLKDKISKSCKVQGIPSLVIFDGEFNTITTEGRSALAGDPEGREIPWHPKPVKNLKDGPGQINEIPTLLAFLETSDAAEQKAVEGTLTPIAEKYIQAAKETGEDPAFSFVMVTESSGLAPRIRGMLQLPSLPPAPHEQEKMAPRVALLDIPSDGAYYLAPEGMKLGATDVDQFLADYGSGKLDRMQLG
jgi:hypothetical protein